MLRLPGTSARMSETLFKSESMTKFRFFIPPEAAYYCIGELGELGR